MKATDRALQAQADRLRSRVFEYRSAAGIDTERIDRVDRLTGVKRVVVVVDA